MNDAQENIFRNIAPMKQDGKKILIVEDDKPMAHAMEIKFGKSGFLATITHNGQEALDLLEKETFDLILLDLVMPIMDGFKVLAALKEKNNTIPVVVTSNLNQDEDIIRAKSLGAKDFIVKSNTPLTEIIRLIKNYP